MTLLDLTIGFNETDLFDVRYNELRGIVDKFIIVEATHTHSGLPKELYFTNNASKYGDDVSIYVWDNAGFPNNTAGAWLRENMQRELLMKATHGYDGMTYAMLSDMDEIPSRKAVQLAISEIVENDLVGVWRFEQVLSYLYMNTIAGTWCGTKLFPLLVPRQSQSTRPMTDDIRYRPENLITGTFPDGGWHFSSCGNTDRVLQKMRSFAHFNDDGIRDMSAASIQQAFDKVVDPFNYNPLTTVPIYTLPAYVRENSAYFIAKGYIK